MIRAIKGDCPEILKIKGNEEHGKMLEKFQKGETKFKIKNSIYGDHSVKAALIRDNGDKCCFCETKSPRDFRAVEHYRPKTAYRNAEKEKRTYPGYFWLAYEWDNLFLICDVCNTSFKNDLFPLESGSIRAHKNNLLIDKEIPSILSPLENPSQHLRYRAYKLIPKTNIGEKTIELLGLNHPLETGDFNRNNWAEKLQYEREEYYQNMKFIYSKGGNEIISKATNRKSMWSYMIKCALEDKFKY